MEGKDKRKQAMSMARLVLFNNGPQPFPKGIRGNPYFENYSQKKLKLLFFQEKTVFLIGLKRGDRI